MSNSQALVYDPDAGLARLRAIPIREVRPGEARVRVTLSTICRSDLHTLSGRRSSGGPTILGHEICGAIAALGDPAPHDYYGRELAIGDRVTWSIAASCGTCFFCTTGLPQKCETLFKYGHQTLDSDTPLSGGFAHDCFLLPGTAIFPLADDLPDCEAVFVNCATATAAALVRTADVQPGERVLVQGAGLLGLCVAAFCAERGALATVSDVSADRLRLAEEFGAHETLAADRTASRTRGFDAAIEVCGQPSVIPQGIDLLRTGGRYAIAGCVFPQANATLDMYNVITKCLRITGVHNYRPDDLAAALELVAARRAEYPFDRVVARVFGLNDYDEALRLATEDAAILRVALRP